MLSAIGASIEPGLDDSPDTGSERGAIVIKYRFYKQIFDNKMIGGWGCRM
jgi:hypothetical protein